MPLVVVSSMPAMATLETQSPVRAHLDVVNFPLHGAVPNHLPMLAQCHGLISYCTECLLIHKQGNPGKLVKRKNK